MAKVCRAWVSLYLCELGGGVHGINTDDISAWDYICMCTSQVPIIPCIVTCHWNKTISSQRGLVGEGLCPHKGQKPSCSGTRCGVDTSKAHPVELGESSAETTSSFVQGWFWAGNCPLSTIEKQLLSFMSTASLQAFWIFNNTICLPRNRAWRSLSRHWYSRWAGGLWWHGAGWQSFPSRSILKLKSPTDGSELRMWPGKEAMQVVPGTRQEA